MKRFLHRAKILVVLSLSIPVYAAKDIIVDHNVQTITIAANFVTFAPIQETLHEAAALWNVESGKYFYEIQTPDTILFYAVNFNLVVNDDPFGDLALNIVSVIPDKSKLCKKRKQSATNAVSVYDKPVGISDGTHIGINERFKDDKYILAHEMGHNLGLTHSEGLMHTHVGCQSITIFNIEESLAQLHNSIIDQKNTLRKKVEKGNVPDQMYYVGVVANDKILNS